LTFSQQGLQYALLPWSIHEDDHFLRRSPHMLHTFMALEALLTTILLPIFLAQ
jgi:hypothetical protein